MLKRAGCASPAEYDEWYECTYSKEKAHRPARIVPIKQWHVRRRDTDLRISMDAPVQDKHPRTEEYSPTRTTYWYRLQQIVPFFPAKEYVITGHRRHFFLGQRADEQCSQQERKILSFQKNKREDK